MAFGDRRDNSSYDSDKDDIRKSLNTGGRGLYNENGYEPSAISMSFWKELLKIQVAPALPEEKRTTSSKYDYNSGIYVFLTSERARDFYNCIKYFYDIYMTGANPDKMGIATKSGLIEIATGQSLGIKGNPRSIFLVLYDNIDDEIKTDVYITFEFPESKCIKNYNNTTGLFDAGNLRGTFETFMSDILNFCEASSGAVAHAVRWGNRFDRYQDNLKMAELLKANGIKIDESGRVAFEKKESPFNRAEKKGATPQPTRPAINSTISDIERELDSADTEDDDLPF